MRRRPPRSTRTDTLFPYTTLFRSAVASQNQAMAARGAGRFRDEIVPVTIKGRKGDTVVADDEYIRTGATQDAMTGLRPAFKKDGTVTAAHARGINDGGSAIILLSAQAAHAHNTPVLGRLDYWPTFGV